MMKTLFNFCYKHAILHRPSLDLKKLVREQFKIFQFSSPVGQFSDDVFMIFVNMAMIYFTGFG